MNYKKSGFTLIELIIVIVLLGIISLAGINLISPVFTGYVDTKTKDLLFSEAKFAVERIAKEVRESIPNTVRLAPNDTSTSGIQFCLFDYNGYYSDNISGENKIQVDANSFAKLNINDNISIYNTKSDYLYNLIRVYKIISDNNSENSFTFNKIITEDSPYFRYFKVSTPVTYYLNSGIIYRAFNYPLTDADRGTNNSASNIITNILSKDVASLKFDYLPPTLLRNGLVKIEVVMKKNDISVTYAQNVHIRNKP